MSAGKAIFITGIVIGTTTGLSLGHFTLWSRASQSPVERETAVLVEPIDPPLSDFDLWDPLASLPQANEVYYAPVADAQLQDCDETLPIDVSPPAERPPQPSLLPPPDASPIGVGIDYDLRAAIEREVPNVGDEQIEVWLEVLQGLSEDDAVGILRVWQLHEGETPPTVTAEIPPINMAPMSPSTHGDSELSSEPQPFDGDDASEREVLAQLREITLHNMANVETPGYRSLTPIVSNLAFPTSSTDVAGNVGIRLERVTLCIDAGPIIETGEQWDVAIRHQPSVFFKLHDDGEVALTRYGHLELDEHHRLCIAANGRRWSLEPEVTLPEGAALVRIGADGRVLTRRPGDDAFAEAGRIEPCQVHSPQSLEPIGDRLYRVTDPLNISAPPTEPFELAQGCLEGSNVELVIERNRLAWIDELLRLRQ